MADHLSLLLTIINTLVSALSIYINPENVKGHILTVADEIKSFGYPVETHFAKTEDGYILGLHRIPDSPKFRGESKKHVVLLYHGIFSCSGAWIFNGPDNGLGYLLADLGYDVWMGNIRGNTYSRNHTRLNPDTDKAFWDFSFHEQGVYDIPATIDYILEHTGQPNLIYVGHSQGTTQFYVMASQKPEYNDKIRAMFSLAPIVTMADAESPMMRLTQALNISAKQLEKLFGIGEIFRNSAQNINLANALCVKSGRFMQVACETGLSLFTGFDRDQQNWTLLFPELTKHLPSGASTKQALHYLQGSTSAKFRQYDYGRRGNLVRYRTEEPPEYNLSVITAPVALHYSSNDWMASVEGVELLYKHLANPIGKFLVPFPKFNHHDYQFAADVKSLLYDQLINK